MKEIRVTNLTRGGALVDAGWVADNAWTRLRGLIGHAPLARGEGLLIMPCSSIHTHFMGFPIDVLYVDKANRVIALDQGMAPWRFGRIHRHARFVLELPDGAIAGTKTDVGDQLHVGGYEI